MALVKGDAQGDIKPDEVDKVPQSSAVNIFHTNSDVDRSKDGQHHTIGIGQNKVNAGTHMHGGKDSRKIGYGLGLTVTGAKGGNVALANLITMLKNVIDFQDNTT